MFFWSSEKEEGSKECNNNYYYQLRLGHIISSEYNEQGQGKEMELIGNEKKNQNQFSQSAFPSSYKI
jgi:hypothetical protein